MRAKDQLEQIAKRRRDIGKRISDAPQHWKICVGCQSLNAGGNIFCPFCRSYGFDFDRGEVLAMAVLLGDRPIAVECAVLPRETSVQALMKA